MTEMIWFAIGFTITLTIICAADVVNGNCLAVK